MNADFQELHDALIDEATTISGENRILRAHLYATIRSYCQTREAIEAISAAPNASYSIAGRSFTKANLADLKKHLEPIAETLAEYLPAFRAIHHSTTPAFHGVRF